MSDYTPTENAARRHYALSRIEDGGIDRPGASVEFDRFIAKMKTAAWDEGYATGQVDYANEQENPYREDMS